MKHFLTESDFDRNEIIEVFEHASSSSKTGLRDPAPTSPARIGECSSTRTAPEQGCPSRWESGNWAETP